MPICRKNVSIYRIECNPDAVNEKSFYKICTILNPKVNNAKGPAHLKVARPLRCWSLRLRKREEVGDDEVIGLTILSTLKEYQIPLPNGWTNFERYMNFL